MAKNDLVDFKEALKDQSHHINNILLDLGFVYGSEYQTQEVYTPSAQVGARAPHCWLLKDGQHISSLDLFHHQFVLLCHLEAHHWQDNYSHFPCKIVTIGSSGEYLDKDHDFLDKYGITKQGAVLLRPDGHVAWHANDQTGEVAHFTWL